MTVYLRLETLICNGTQSPAVCWLQTCLYFFQVCLQLFVIRTPGQCLQCWPIISLTLCLRIIQHGPDKPAMIRCND